MERYRFYPDAPVYYVTFSVVDWLPVFVSERACRIVTDSLNYCHQHKSLRTNAFVVMPTHLHLVVFDAQFDAERLRSTLTDFRKFTGRNLCELCGERMPGCFSEVFRTAAGADRERRFWQPTHHPVAIESERFWRQKSDYLHENPTRKGLVIRPEHWRFSSAAFWLSDGRVPSEVVLSALEW